MNKNIDVNVYKGSETLLVASGIVKEIKAALQTKVNLPSGGYLFIQTTEALTVIDVNSGKFVSSTTQDETIVKTNLEAVHEIARQLRLRNIGGMVIVDFIDMNNRRDKLAIMEELEIALDKDKAKPQVGQLSDLGLVELTRHRQGQSLSEIFGKKCPHCQGTGYIADDLNFSAPVVEGEIKAKAAKLKIPAQQIKNKTPNYKQNKVFNNPNNNPLLENEQNNNNNNNQNQSNQQNQQNNQFNQQRKNFNKFNNRNNQPKAEQQEQTTIQNENKVIEEEIKEDIKIVQEQLPTVEEITVDKEKIEENTIEKTIENEQPKEKKQRKSSGRKKQTKTETKETTTEEKKEEKEQTEIEVKKKKPGRKPKKQKTTEG